MGNKLLDGSIYKAIFTLAIPLVLANLLQTVYNLTDTFWVGRLGAEAVAAVSLSFPLIFLLISLGTGLTIAGSILVAQYKGRSKLKKVNEISAQTLLVSIAVSLIITVLGFISARYALLLMGAAPDVLPDAVLYLRYSFIGVIFLFAYLAFHSSLRGIGQVKVPFYIVLTTVILNFFLDPLFILGYKFVPALGVAGAAMATVVTQALSAIIGMVILFSGKYEIKLKFRDFKPNFKVIKKLFTLGIPTSIESSIRALGMLLMMVLVATFGTVVVAAYGIGMRIFGFIIIPAVGFSMANSTLVGQSMGANKVERAVKVSKISTTLSFLILSFVGLLFFIFSRQIITAFVPGEPEVIMQGVYFLRLIALSFGFIGIQVVLNGTFRGSGNTFMSMLFATIWSALILLFAYLLSKHSSLGVEGIWWSYPIANVLGATMVTIWFLRGKWKEKRLIEEDVEFSKTL